MTYPSYGWHGLYAPDDLGLAHCTKCGDTIPLDEEYPYGGDLYHKNCLPKPEVEEDGE